MLEEDKRTQSNSHRPSDAGTGAAALPHPGLRVASEGVGDSELQGLVSNWEERLEYCSWMMPGQSSACSTFLPQEAGCPKNPLEQWIFL